MSAPDPKSIALATGVPGGDAASANHAIPARTTGLTPIERRTGSIDLAAPGIMAHPEAIRTQNPRAARNLAVFARLAAAAVLVVGITVVAGYALRIPVLLTLRTGLRAMSPLTAISFCFLALSLAAKSFRRSRWARVPSAASLALSFLVLAQHMISGADTISQPIAAAVFGFPGVLAGRMSPATAIGQGLLTLSLLLPGRAARGHVSASTHAPTQPC